MRSLVVALSLVAATAFAEEEPKNVLALETRWRAEGGEALTLSKFEGQWYALTFVYTSCAGSCPLTTAKLKRLATALDKAGRPLPLVVVSLDPAHDTPEALAAYRKRYGLEAATRWRVLVGEESQVRALTMLLGFKYARNAESGAISHDNTIYLIAPDGSVRTEMSSLDQPMETFLSTLPPATK